MKGKVKTISKAKHQDIMRVWMDALEMSEVKYSDTNGDSPERVCKARRKKV